MERKFIIIIGLIFISICLNACVSPGAKLVIGEQVENVVAEKLGAGDLDVSAFTNFIDKYNTNKILVLPSNSQKDACFYNLSLTRKYDCIPGFWIDYWKKSVINIDIANIVTGTIKTMKYTYVKAPLEPMYYNHFCHFSPDGRYLAATYWPVLEHDPLEVKSSVTITDLTITDQKESLDTNVYFSGLFIEKGVLWGSLPNKERDKIKKIPQTQRNRHDKYYSNGFDSDGNLIVTAIDGFQAFSDISKAIYVLRYSIKDHRLIDVIDLTEILGKAGLDSIFTVLKSVLKVIDDDVLLSNGDFLGLYNLNTKRFLWKIEFPEQTHVSYLNIASNKIRLHANTSGTLKLLIVDKKSGEFTENTYASKLDSNIVLYPIDTKFEKIILVELRGQHSYVGILDPTTNNITKVWNGGYISNPIFINDKSKSYLYFFELIWREKEIRRIDLTNVLKLK